MVLIEDCGWVLHSGGGLTTEEPPFLGSRRRKPVAAPSRIGKGRFLCRAFSTPGAPVAANLGLRPRLVYVALSALCDAVGLDSISCGRVVPQAARKIGWHKVIQYHLKHARSLRNKAVFSLAV